MNNMTDITLPYLLCLTVIFLVYWIIPCYPRYRSLFHCSLIHYTAALLAAVMTLSFSLLVFPDRCIEMMFMIPLMATISFVDYKTQEIPQLPVFLIGITCFGRAESNYFVAAVFSSVLAILALAGKIGFGDVELAAVWTMYLGNKALVGICLACVLCFALEKIKKESSETKIPFAPYICAGMAPMLFLPV